MQFVCLYAICLMKCQVVIFGMFYKESCTMGQGYSLYDHDTITCTLDPDLGLPYAKVLFKIWMLGPVNLV